MGVTALFVRDRDFYRTTVKIAIPVVLQGLITIGVNLADTWMLGNYGEVQLSASSLAGEFINLFQILCFGIGGGAGVLTAQYWGSGDIPALKRVVTIMLRLTMGIAMAFLMATWLIPGRIMAVYTPDTQIIEKGILYFQYSIPTYLLMGLSLTLTIVLRSVRQVRVPLMASIASFFVNIFFNWVFIYGNLGAPEMQISGAALGTLIARVVECAVIVVYFFIMDTHIGYRVREAFRKVTRGDWKRYMLYSVPVIVSDAFLAVGNNIASVIMGHIGASFVAANAIIALVMRLSTIFNQGISNASGIVTGNTLGAGETQKAYQQSVTFLSLSVIVGILAGAVILAISPLVIGSFNIAQETKRIATDMMLAMSVIVVFQAVQGVMTKGVLRAGGDTRFLMVADVLFLWLASIPLGYLAGLVWGLPTFWIYIALRLDWIIKSVWCVFRLRSRKWMRVIRVDRVIANVEEPGIDGLAVEGSEG